MFIDITNSFHEKDIEKYTLISAFCYLPIFFIFGYLLGFISKLGRFHIKQSFFFHFLNLILLCLICIFKNSFILISLLFFVLYVLLIFIMFYIFINCLNNINLKFKLFNK